MFKIILPLIFLLISCSQRQPLGTREHFFGRKGKHIVWIQVPGLEPEHLALLKFNKDTANEKIPFESMNCMGSMWSYNLFNLRPDASKGFLSQILGSQKITGTCKDFDRKNVWDYFSTSGYEIGVYEGPNVGKNSVNQYLACDENFRPLKNSFLWLQTMAPKEGKTFHYQEKTGLDVPDVYYDKSCQQGACIIPLKTNVKQLWQEFSKKNAKTFFTVRMYGLQKSLEKKDSNQLIEELVEIQDLLKFFQEQAKTKSLLTVISSSAARGFELPKAGSTWAGFLKKGRHVNYRKTRLQSPIWASGEGAENFCGIYEEAQVLKRFIWMPERDLFNLTF